MIDRALSDNSVSFIQSPLARSAARLPLGVTETEKLRALAPLPIEDFEQGDSETIRGSELQPLPPLWNVALWKRWLEILLRFSEKVEGYDVA